MIKDGEKMGEVICKVKADKVKKIDVPFASEILDLLEQTSYKNIMDVFHIIQKKIWKSLNLLEQQDYLQFLFMEDGRLEVKKLIN